MDGEIFALLYKSDWDHDNNKELYNLSSNDIEKLVQEVKQSTDSNDLNWNYSMGRCCLRTAEAEKVPELIKAFSGKGLKLFLNNGSVIPLPVYSQNRMTE
jgi:hypothetical protein